MDDMEQTEAQRELTEANNALSEVCFKLGRQLRVIKNWEKKLQEAKTAFHNLEVDQDKAAAIYEKALDAQQREAQAARAKNPLPDVPEVSPQPQLELIQ